MKSIFENNGKSEPMAGNRPLQLVNAASVWWIETGVVDLFITPKLPDQMPGRRYHLLRMSAGQMIFSFDGLILDHQVVAIGSQDARALQMDREHWLRLVQTAGLVPDTEALLNRWIAGLCQRLAIELPPRGIHLLEPDQPMDLSEGASAGCGQGAAWVKAVTGEFRLLNRDELVVTPDCPPVPLCPPAWLTMTLAGCVQIEHTADLLARGQLFSSLDAFHQAALSALRNNIDRQNRHELEDLTFRDQRDQIALDGALRSLGSIVSPDHPGATGAGPTDPLFSACQTIGRVMGIPFRMPSQAALGRRQDSLLSLICRVSGVRFRSVLLRDDWWRQDNGPLLAFDAESRKPAALIPARHGDYWLHTSDPIRRQRVTRAVADTLQPIAIMFYRPFPARLMSGWEFIRFGFEHSLRDMTRVILMGLAGAILGLLTPIMTGILFDSVIPEASRGQLIQVVIVLVACALAGTLFEFTKAIAMLRIESRADTALQSAVWDRLMGLPVTFFRNYTVGDLTSRSMGVNAIRQILSGVTVTAVLAGIFSTLNFGLLFYYDARLSLAATLLAGFGLSITCGVSYLKLGYQRKVNTVQGAISGLVLQLIGGIAKIRAAGAENRAFAIWAARFRDQKDLALRSGTVDLALGVFNSGFPLIASMTLFAWMTLSSRTDLSTGQFLAFNAAFGSFQGALLQMSAALTSSLVIFPLYERLQPILQTLPETDEAKASPGELMGGLEVSHLQFRYAPDGPLILKDVSIACQPGEFVALVGSSGCGKSTLLRLLLGFETPESGSIYYDGKDLNGLDIREVRRQIGVVLQNGGLMPGDIFKNIVGASALTQADAWEAVRMAGLEADIKRMPMGLNTVLSVGGGNLSGGQRQRLLIARALVRRPRMLFFDEATSALDNQTQATVSASLEGLRATRLVIAHRLSTILKADRIYVMEAGRVVQVGTFAELINQPGLFAEMAKRQMS